MTDSYADTKVLTIGGSRNIGYFSSLRLLGTSIPSVVNSTSFNVLSIEKGATVTFLLRKPTVFDQDESIQDYIKLGKARLIKGDALVKSDVANAWTEAAKGNGNPHVDILLFTVGGLPKFKLTKGFIIHPHNLVTQSLLNTLSTLPSTPQPKVITISSTGLTKKSHRNLPWALKPFYAYFLAVPHRDKVGAERAVAYCAGWGWDTEVEGEVGDDIMGEGWIGSDGLPKPGTFKNIVVVRPALLTDGDAKGAYRVEEGDIRGWTVSRKDVAHFVVEGVLANWGQWCNKCVGIAY